MHTPLLGYWKKGRERATNRRFGISSVTKAKAAFTRVWCVFLQLIPWFCKHFCELLGLATERLLLFFLHFDRMSPQVGQSKALIFQPTKNAQQIQRIVLKGGQLGHVVFPPVSSKQATILTATIVCVVEFFINDTNRLNFDHLNPDMIRILDNVGTTLPRLLFVCFRHSSCRLSPSSSSFVIPAFAL